MDSLKTKIHTKNAKITWVGTGVMGSPMCGHLIQAGYDMTIFTRTASKAESLKLLGAKMASSIEKAVEEADVIITMVGFPEDVEQVYFNGILESAKKNAVVIDMTTTKPSLAEKINLEAGKQSIYTLDAPVSGGDVGARNKTLSIMVGGERDVFETVLPIFQILGKQTVYQGKAGSGQHTKMCNQIVIASTMVGVCESLLYGKRAGLNLGTMLESISGGAAGCWTLDNLAPRILKRNFDPGFFVDHFIKDMGIALEESRHMKLRLQGLDLAYSLYQEVKVLGHGLSGTHALMIALEKLNQEELSK